MHFLRDNALARYFAALDRTDRATFFIVAGLALALGLVITALTRSRAGEVSRFTAPPAWIEFASRGVRPC